MYNSNTNVTIKAATTRSIINGRRSHQELMKSQSVTVELNPSSGDMDKTRESLAYLLTSRPDSGVITQLRGRRRSSKGEAKHRPRRRNCVRVHP